MTNTKKDPTKEPKRSRNTKLILMLFVTSCILVVAFVFNMIQIWSGKSLNQGLQESLSSKTGRTLSNQYYTIGNNPTEVEKNYFEELTKAIKDKDNLAYAEKVVDCFVSDYFTWTNKDGNYEVGGLQYIYADKFVDFDNYSRWNFYSQLDSYITQYGRKKLPEVASVELNSPVQKLEDYSLKDNESASPMPCYQVDVKWTYGTSTTVDLSKFPTSANFKVVDHNGRMEIVEINGVEAE